MNLEGSAYECAWEDGYDEGFDAGELSAAPEVTALQQENQDLCDALMQARDQIHVLDQKVNALSGNNEALRAALRGAGIIESQVERMTGGG